MALHDLMYNVQLGLAVALPIHPGAGFGSVVGSVGIAGDQSYGGRLDFGYERIGQNGGSGEFHDDRFMGGIGVLFKAPISPTIALVTGRMGAIQFGHFRNLGINEDGLYLGSTSFFTDMSSDLLTITGGNNLTNLGFNLPLGLLVQSNQRLAFTLHAGYSLQLSTSSGRTLALHFVPVGIEVVVTPAPALDIGLHVFVDGYVGGDLNMGYLDMRGLMAWLRFRV